MEKPIELTLKEFEEKIVADINNANLQPFLLKPILEKIYNQVVVLEQQAYEMKKAEYENSAKEGEENGKD